MLIQVPLTAGTPSGPSGGGSVLYVSSFASLPSSGSSSILYVTIDTGNLYRWDGVGYVLFGDMDSYSDHIADIGNPHQTTKDQIGLGNVDDTNDMDKPVSTETALALSGKCDAGDISTSGLKMLGPHILGRHGSGVGDLQTINVGAGLSLDGATLNVTVVPHPQKLVIRIPNEISADGSASQGVWDINNTGDTITISSIDIYLMTLPVSGTITVNFYKSSGVDGNGADGSATTLFAAAIDMSTSYKKTVIPDIQTIEAGRYVSMRVHVSTGTTLATGLTAIINYA